MKYTAIVRDIEEGTYIHPASFVYGMRENVGNILTLTIQSDGWYRDEDDGYVYHPSWLKDITPVGENKMSTKYLVVSVRKSDGMVFFPDGAQRKDGIDDFDTALKVAQEKACKNSDAYTYTVYKCLPVASVELDNPPTKVTYYRNPF